MGRTCHCGKDMGDSAALQRRAGISIRIHDGRLFECPGALIFPRRIRHELIRRHQTIVGLEFLIEERERTHPARVVTIVGTRQTRCDVENGTENSQT